MQSFIPGMEVFTVVLDDSSSHMWGYPYPKPAYPQPRITNVQNNSTMPIPQQT